MTTAVGRRGKRTAILAALGLGLALTACGVDAGKSDVQANGTRPNVCAEPGQWIDPATGSSILHTGLIADAARRSVVLLGKNHMNEEHHRWQLSTLAALQGHAPRMVIGFESFPRRVQPVLDRWVAGELDEKAFLDAVEWNEVWGIDAALYMPMFQFARQNRIPMVALNVDRALVRRVGQEGWEAVPVSQREGVGDPVPASAAYRTKLEDIYAQHGRGDEPDAEPDPEAVQRFIEAQLLWDRAMAEAVAAARQRPESPLVVAIVGRGHLEFGHGIPHQLESLGVSGSAVLLPLDVTEACTSPEPAIADAVFAMAPPAERSAERPRPRLGVYIETVETGAQVTEVMDASVAEAAGLRSGDVIVSAAGSPVTSATALVEIVQRQAPGTWLPLSVRRDEQTTEVIAKFPARFE